MHAILQQVEGHTERSKAELLVETKLLETKEILVDVFGKITTDELLAAVVESTDAVCSGIGVESRTLIT